MWKCRTLSRCPGWRGCSQSFTAVSSDKSSKGPANARDSTLFQNFHGTLRLVPPLNISFNHTSKANWMALRFSMFPLLWIDLELDSFLPALCQFRDSQPGGGSWGVACGSVLCIKGLLAQLLVNITGDMTKTAWKGKRPAPHPHFPYNLAPTHAIESGGARPSSSYVKTTLLSWLSAIAALLQ